jgi:ribosomal protein S18 acetylase RimI-like enzyme
MDQSRVKPGIEENGRRWFAGNGDPAASSMMSKRTSSAHRPLHALERQHVLHRHHRSKAMPPALRRLGASDWSLYRDIRLRSLAESPNAFGSTLAIEQAHRDDAWSARLSRAAASDHDCVLVAEQDGVALGLIWAQVDPSDTSTVNLFQMWVAPALRGQGIGHRLLQEAIDWARRRQARRVHLGVTDADTPAMRLYTRAGFAVVGAPAPLRPGSALLAQSMQLLLHEPAA